jgi:ABC-type branched-subunit amino acid transport system substrate-binding protein
MKKRHLLAGILALLMVVVLTAVACGSGDGATTTSAAPTETTAAPTETTAAPTETTAAPTETTAAPTETTAASTEPIKVGHIVDLTGYQQNVGFVMKAGLDYAFTNAMVGSRPVQLVEADAKSDTAGAVEAAKRLVESEGVMAIIGPTQIAQKEAVAAYCQEVGIPIIFYNPTPPELLEDNEWVVASGGTTLEPMTVIADYIYKDLGYKTIDVIGGEDTGAKAFFDPFIEHYEALGGTVVQRQDTPYGEDYSVYLANLEPADALVTWYGGSAGISMLKQYIELGIDEQMELVGLYHGGMLDPFAMNSIAQSDPATAEKLIGTRTVMAWNPDSTDPVNVAYVDGITPTLKYGPPGDDGYACAVQGGQLFLAAANAVTGELTPAALRDALLTTDFVGPEGREYFANGSQAATKPFYIVEVIKVDIPNVGPVYKYATVKTYEDVPPEGLSK